MILDYRLLVFAVSFLAGFATLLIYKFLNRKKRWAIGIDINKPEQKEICESTGITLLLPVWAATVYLILTAGHSENLIAWILLVTGFAVIGFIDDTKHKFLSKATPWGVRALPAAVFALLFSIFFFYQEPLMIIPLALYLAVLASFENTFAGLNGWEVGSGLIISFAVMLLVSSSQLFWISLILSGAILALFLWNVYPAKVFPGDSGTLLIGSGIAGILVLTKNPTIMLMGALFFLPHIIDFALKMITNPKDPSQVKMRPYRLLENGKLTIPKYKDGKIRYDFAKLLFRIFGPMKEWQVVILIWIIVAANCLFWLAAFGRI